MPIYSIYVGMRSYKKDPLLRQQDTGIGNVISQLLHKYSIALPLISRCFYV